MAKAKVSTKKKTKETEVETLVRMAHAMSEKNPHFKHFVIAIDRKGKGAAGVTANCSMAEFAAVIMSSGELMEFVVKAAAKSCAASMADL